MEEAHNLYTTAEQAGIKHAYAVTHRYDAGVAWIADLLASGAVGQVSAIDIVQVVPYLQELTPWGWMDSLAHIPRFGKDGAIKLPSMRSGRVKDGMSSARAKA